MNIIEKAKRLKEARANATQGDWSHGRTLRTTITKKWSKEQWDKNEERERRWIFAGFNSCDHGRGRIPVCEFAPTQPFLAENVAFVSQAANDTTELCDAVLEMAEALGECAIQQADLPCFNSAREVMKKFGIEI